MCIQIVHNQDYFLGICITFLKHFFDELDQDYFVKRVIGLPGETIEVIGDQLFVNGTLIEQDFLDDEYARSHIPGARQLDPMRARDGLRGAWTSNRPADLLPPACFLG